MPSTAAYERLADARDTSRVPGKRIADLEARILAAKPPTPARGPSFT
jgi:hypothetical protein